MADVLSAGRQSSTKWIRSYRRRRFMLSRALDCVPSPTRYLVGLGSRRLLD